MKNILTFIYIFLALISQAQEIKGVIFDSISGKNLPFATIQYNLNQNKGVVTNIDGEFIFNISKDDDTSFIASYIAYQPKKIKIEKNKYFYKVALIKKNNTLDEVHIIPGKNPAHRILKNIRKKSKENNPDKYKAYKCKDYSKVLFSYEIPEDTAQYYTVFEKRLDSVDLFFSETISYRTYKKPGKYKLDIIAIRTPGFKKTPMYMPIDDIQEFHFYNDYIFLFDKKFLNPLADRNFNVYRFYLIDSMQVDTSILYSIKFKPKSKNRDDLLKGILKVSSNNWALQTVVAEPNNKNFINIKIEQKYTFLKKYKLWFTSELNYKLQFNINRKNYNLPSFYEGKSYISEVEILKTNQINGFGTNWINLEDNCLKKDSLFWEKNRIKPLTKREVLTYNLLDTAVNLDKIPIFTEKLLNFKIPVKFIDFSILDLYNRNDFEGHRFGLGIGYNSSLCERFIFGGKYAFGLTDKKHKYSTYLNINIHKKTNFKAYLSFTNDYKTYQINDFSYIYNNDFYKELKIGLNSNLSYFNLDLSLAKQNIETYIDNEAKIKIAENFFIAKLDVKFNYYKKNIPSWTDKYSSIENEGNNEKKYIPKIKLSFEKTFEQIFNYDISFIKAEMELYNTLIIRKLGELHFMINFGKYFGDFAYSKLYKGEYLFSKASFFYNENCFQTVANSEFVHSEYIYLFFNYKFNPIALPTKYSAPQFIIHNNLGFGINKFKPNYKIDNFHDMSKGLFESGIILDNILKIPIINLIYLGLGGGAFYRYGYYSSDINISNNLAYKFSITLSF